MSLRLKNITKSFGEKTVFEDFSYDFGDSGIFAIIGDSGRGKTTLLRIISGLDKDFQGEVFADSAAYAFQEYRLFPTLTALQNITEIVYKNPSSEQINAAKRMLLDFGFKEEELHLYPRALSGGMKQRVSLCRALLAEKKILLLDEPFKELDDGLREILRGFIRETAKKSLVLLSTHGEGMLKDLDAKIIRI